MKSGIAAFVAALWLAAITRADGPPVTVSLRSGWSAAPVALEILQFVANESPDHAFPFISWLEETGLHRKPPRDVYVTALNAFKSGRFGISNQSVALFPMSIASHNDALRVEAYYQYYRDVVVPRMRPYDKGCTSWVELHGTQVCSISALKVRLDDWSDIQPEILPFDLIYNKIVSTDAVPIAVLYADVSDGVFGDLHRYLREVADNRRIQYILRFKRSSNLVEPLHLLGFGVELALKSTEYLVTDDRSLEGSNEKTENDETTWNGHDLDVGSHDNSILNEEDEPTVPKLKPDEIKDLGTKTSQYIITASNPLEAFVRITQDFPKYSHIMAKRKLDVKLLAVARQNGLSVAVPGTNRLLLNGQDIDAASIDVFRLLRMMRIESAMLSSLVSQSLSLDQSMNVLAATQTKSSNDLGWGEGFNVQRESVIWWNDLEKDSRYKYWPKGITEILKPAFPGQLRYVRKNLFSVALCLDLSNPIHTLALMDVFTFIERDVPLRFGIIPVIHPKNDSHHSVEVAKGLFAILRDRGRKEAKVFLTAIHSMLKEEHELTFKSIQNAFFSATNSIDFARVLRDDVSGLRSLNSRLGLNLQDGAIFMNGKYIPLDESWQQSMMGIYQVMLEFLQTKTYAGILADKTDVYEYFMKQPNVYGRRNPLTFVSPTTPLRIIDFLTWADRNLITKIQFLTSQNGASLSYFVVADFFSKRGLELALSSLKYLISSKDVRILFLHTGNVTESPVSFGRATKCIALNQNHEDLRGLIADLTSGAKAFDFSSYIDPSLCDSKFFESSSTVDDRIKGYLSSLPYLSLTEPLIVLNGRVVGPITEDSNFDVEDFQLLSSIELEHRTSSISQLLNEMIKSDNSANRPPRSVAQINGSLTDPGRWYADTVLMAVSGVSYQTTRLQDESERTGRPYGPRLKPSSFSSWAGNRMSFLLGDEQSAAFRFVAVLDPVSAVAQRLSPILEALSNVEGVSIRVLLSPVHHLTELPLTRFYRYVLRSEPLFDAEGLEVNAIALFKGIPVEPLLTLGLDVPRPWLVRPVESFHDLDNIKLSSLSSDWKRRGVEATFELRSILVEGHCQEANTHAPPRGVQYILGTAINPHIVDTITMTNLGYIQLKANPGVWNIGLREGRSYDIYTIDSVTDGLQSYSSDGIKNGSARIILNTFEGVTIFPKVSKRPGKEAEDVLAMDNDNADKTVGLWTQLKNSVFGSSNADVKSNVTINVFSVASGHLYERFLGIMMLSVVKRTKNPVKFWLIENFLSPSFMEFIPHLAEAYGFEYELVTYKWPHWLRGQTEKQRVIWGYKILFLDVLFPLGLEKVIFVDADQVVRTDLIELVNLDLHGAVYGYTPFCDSRTEMEGFRFWKTGYWKSHLSGRPYHISALYVIDLVRFRQFAAGDRLRQQYQMLSADPNSLANLDQDLPNNMIHQIPMFSLPQEWLWCETWCSDAELTKAKTIDLCNNPLTKEPKLERAKRILPEWEGLDNEVQSIFKKVSQQKDSEAGHIKKVHDEL